MRDIIIRNSDRFKSVFVSVNLLLPLEAKLNSKNALLAEVLKKSSSMFKNEKELERALAGLYSTTINVDVEKLDNIYNIRFGLELLNVKYMNKEDIKKVKEIFCDLICSPNIQNNVFDLNIFEREKNALIEKINEEKDDKKKYALKELEKDMYAGTEYRNSTLGTVEDIANITNEDLAKHYNYVRNTSRVVVTASGNLEGMEDFPQDVYNTVCEKWGNNKLKLDKNVDNIDTNLNARVESQDIAQSVLCIGLKLKNATKEDMFALMLYSTVLGGTPASKLFQNVREKESLAYFAKAIYNRFKSSIYMYAGVDPKNNDKAKEVMLKQVELIKDKDLTDVEFSAAKEYLISAYKQMEDTKASIIKNLLNNELFFEREIDTKQIIEKISLLTKEDVVSIAKRIVVTNIFLLGGKAND